MKSAAFLKSDNKSTDLSASIFKKDDTNFQTSVHGGYHALMGADYNFGQMKVYNNDAVLRVQPKLEINQPGDKYEQEADAMADKIIRMPNNESNANKSFRNSTSTIQRKCAHCEEEEEKKLHRKESNSAGITVAPPVVHDVLNSSSGKSLDGSTRSFMESRFNHDFSKVKIHDNSLAAESATSINSLAYTSGNNLVFNSGQYNPHSTAGKRLLAHELTHVVQQSVVSLGSIIQRDIDPACEPFYTRNKSGSVCKAPPNATTVGNEAHKKIQQDFFKAPNQLIEIPIPGAGNVCSESKIEPLFARGRADLVKVVTRDKDTVEVEIGEIKPMNIPGLSLGPSQLKCYQDKMIDAGSLCKPLSNYTPAQLKQAEKDPSTKLAVQMCKSLDAFGKTVKVSKEGLHLPPQAFDLYGRPMSALTCFPGVVCYSCLDPKQESRRDRQPSPGEVMANPGGEAAAGFVTGFLAGAKHTIPIETWSMLLETLSNPMNNVKFQGGQMVGRPLGLVASLTDLVKGLGEVLKLGLEMGPAGTIFGELKAGVKGEQSPTLRRIRMAKDIIEGLGQFVVELQKNPNLLFESAEEIGNLCGEEAGRKFLKEFVAADPFTMGVIAGKVQGYIATEVAMLLVGAEEFAAVAKGISAAARVAKASRFGLKILEILEKIKSLKRVFEALGGASKIRVASEVEAGAIKVAKAEKAAKTLKAEEEAQKALKAGDQRKAIEKARELEALEEAEATEEVAESARRVRR